jgi:hypothetical protein
LDLAGLLVFMEHERYLILCAPSSVCLLDI